MSRKLKVLELFAGTRSIGKAFERKGHEVFSVDWDKQFKDIDLYCDIGQLTAKEILEKFGKPDVIWLSPDCSSYSVCGIYHHRTKNPITGELDPISEYAKFCDEVNKHCTEIVKQLDPKFFFWENPRAAMRKMSWMQQYPRYTIGYCAYGDKRQKPTDIWTNHPNPQFKPLCKPGSPCHEAAPRGSRTGTQGLKGHVERSRIPDAFCDHIVDICEEWIDKDWRICSECGSVMEEGFIVEGFEYEYYCSEECLHKHYSEEEYTKMYKADEAYWTQWY